MNKSTYILVGLFIVLAVIAYLFLRPAGEREASYTIKEADLMIDSSKVSFIRIKRAAGTVSLQKENGEWFVTGKEPDGRRHRADDAAVARALGNLQRMKLVSLISRNPEKQGTFQVDSTGTFVNLVEANGRTKEFVVGKMGPTFSETYIRSAKSNDVYLAGGISAWDLNKELRDWREKSITVLERDSIRSIKYRYKKDHFALVRDSVWLIGKDTALVTEVNAVLNTLSTLKADDFVDSAIGVRPPHLVLELTAPGPVTLTYAPIPPDSSRYRVKASNSDQVFIVNKWNVTPLLKQKRDFLPKTR